MRKLSLTAYGKVGSDWVRLTAAILEDGARVLVRADGSNAILPVLPVTFRTSGDIANVTATLGHRVSMAAVPSVGLPNHDWKGVFTLDEVASKFGMKKSDVALLKATYSNVEELIAA